MSIEKKLPFEPPSWLPQPILHQAEKIYSYGLDPYDIAVLERLATSEEMSAVYSTLQKYLDDENLQKLFNKVWHWDAELGIDLKLYTSERYKEKLHSIKRCLEQIVKDIDKLSVNEVVVPQVLTTPFVSIVHSCRDEFTKEKIEELSNDPLFSRNLPTLTDCLQSIAETIQAEIEIPLRLSSDQYTPGDIKKKGSLEDYRRQICMRIVGAVVKEFCNKGLYTTVGTIVQTLLGLENSFDPSTVRKACLKAGK